MKWCPNRVAWGKFVHSLVGGTSPTKTPSKLYSTLHINAYKWTFPNCDISCIVDQSTNKTTNERDFTIVYEGKTAILGAVLFAWQQTVACVIRKTFSWCCLFWRSVREKSIEFSFHTFTRGHSPSRLTCTSAPTFCLDCCVPVNVGLWQLSVLCDGFGHAVVGILCPSIVSSSRVLDFSVGLD